MSSMRFLRDLPNHIRHTNVQQTIKKANSFSHNVDLSCIITFLQHQDEAAKANGLRTIRGYIIVSLMIACFVIHVLWLLKKA